MINWSLALEIFTPIAFLLLTLGGICGIILIGLWRWVLKGKNK